MQLSSDKSLLAESKVLILYILYKANKPLTNEEFLKLVLSVTDMNYFYFQQFLFRKQLFLLLPKVPQQ